MAKVRISTRPMATPAQAARKRPRELTWRASPLRMARWPSRPRPTTAATSWSTTAPSTGLMWSDETLMKTLYSPNMSAARASSQKVMSTPWAVNAGRADALPGGPMLALSQGLREFRPPGNPGPDPAVCIRFAVSGARPAVVSAEEPLYCAGRGCRCNGSKNDHVGSIPLFPLAVVFSGDGAGPGLVAGAGWQRPRAALAGAAGGAGGPGGGQHLRLRHSSGGKSPAQRSLLPALLRGSPRCRAPSAQDPERGFGGDHRCRGGHRGDQLPRRGWRGRDG